VIDSGRIPIVDGSLAIPALEHRLRRHS
jgi:hypothetical protein